MMSFIKNNLLFISLNILVLLLGIFCLFVTGDDIVRIFSYFVSSFLGIMGIIIIIASYKDAALVNTQVDFLNNRISYLIQGIILILISVFSILYPDYLFRIIIGIVLIIIPTIKLFFDNNKLVYLRNNFWKYIVAILLIVASDAILNTVFLIIGIALIILAIFGVYIFIKNYRTKDNSNIIIKYITKYIINRHSKE